MFRLQVLEHHDMFFRMFAMIADGGAVEPVPLQWQTRQ